MLQWSCGYTDVSPTVRICRVTLRQGSLEQSITATPDDMQRLGQALLDLAKRAKADLAVGLANLPDGMHAPGNGVRGN